MPRIVLISSFANPESTVTPDTRSNAQIIPSTDAMTSASANTSTVISAPCASSGRYSARSLRDSTVGLPPSRVRLLQSPAREDLVDRAVGLEFAQRRIHLVERWLVALAHGDADAAGKRRLVILREARFRISALRDLVGDDRI